MRIVGIDVGGTFTDAVVWDTAAGACSFVKVPSQPDDPAAAFFDALDKSGLALSTIDLIVHGMTLATNTMIERTGARVGLIATEGHHDALDIRRGIRPFGHGYDLKWHPAPPLVRRALRIGVRERIDPRGDVLEPLDELDVQAAIAYFSEQGVESVAVALLFSYANGAHEQQIEDAFRLGAPHLPVSLSSRVLPQWHEYERTSTTVADAYVKPKMATYLEALIEGLRMRGYRHTLLIMKSNGGVATAERAAQFPIETYLSGPAGGVVAGHYVGKAASQPNLIVTDMGGTSFDVSLVTGGDYITTTEAEIEPTIPVAIPLLDVRTIGAGGGSIAWIDAGAALKVGPRSAGAKPGPACYGTGGTDPTVTDANVVLGRLPADRPLASSLAIDRDLARTAVATIAEQLGLSVEQAAVGIIRVCVANMVGQIRAVTSQRGVDPRDYVLVAGGGAGPLHGALIAAELGIERVIVPAYPGLLSASGMVQSDIRIDFLRSFPSVLNHESYAGLVRIIDELQSDGRGALRAEGYPGTPKVEASVEMRYRGQNWQIRVQCDPAQGVSALEHAFDREHYRLYGFALPEHDREAINVRVSVVGPNAEAAALTPRRAATHPAERRYAPVWDEHSGRVEDTAFFDREELPSGWTAVGPMVIAASDSTIWVPAHVAVSIDEMGQLLMSVPGRRPHTTRSVEAPVGERR